MINSEQIVSNSPGDNIRSLGWLIASLLLSIGSLIFIRKLGGQGENFHIAFSLGFMTLVGFILGKIVAIFSFPQLTGYLFAGMLLGPSFLAVITPAELVAVAPINELAVALIALQAGCEISLPMLKEGTKSLLWVIFWQALIIFLGMTFSYWLAIEILHLASHESVALTLCAGVLFASISISKAPADTLAILGETGLKGMLATHILSVVVVIDILVIVVFQIVLLFVKPFVVPGAYFDAHKLVLLSEELLASTMAGVFVGLVTILWFKYVDIFKVSKKRNVLFLLISTFATASMCHYLHYDSLIVFVTGGLLVSNMSKHGHELVHTVETVSLGVMIIFFATAGANLDFASLKIMWPIALVLAFSRIFFTYVGTILGHKMAKDDMPRFKYSFSAYISQAGVTLVLAQQVANGLGGFGQALASLATSVVAINEMIGPVCFKLAIKREQKLFP